MHAWNETLQHELLQVGDGECADVMLDAISATGNAQQPDIGLRRPVPAEIEFQKGLVEGAAVQFVGVDQCPVDVENDGFEFHHSVLGSRQIFASPYPPCVARNASNR